MVARHSKGGLSKVTLKKTAKRAAPGTATTDGGMPPQPLPPEPKGKRAKALDHTRSLDISGACTAVLWRQVRPEPGGARPTPVIRRNRPAPSARVLSFCCTPLYI